MSTEPIFISAVGVTSQVNVEVRFDNFVERDTAAHNPGGEASPPLWVRVACGHPVPIAYKTKATGG
jgi:hypothetical protein